ncbi:MAG: nucleoside kinase [Verrucomicrobia bacterium]|nr:nucleoside kinase [Verrucomicrobiota bacterium]
MRNLIITLEDGSSHTCALGSTVGSLPQAQIGQNGLPFIAALINNDVVSLSYAFRFNCTVRFLTMVDPHGWRVYRNSLSYVLAIALRQLYPSAKFSIEHSFGMGLYCSFRSDRDDGIRPEQVSALQKCMRELIRKNLPIERLRLSYTEAVARFEETGEEDKRKLLTFSNPPSVLGHLCAGFWDISHGPLAPQTGVLKNFDLIHYAPGFVLHFPSREAPTRLTPFQDQSQLFQIFQEHKQWGRILGVDTVGRLNEIIALGEITHFMRTAEALHEKKLSYIADTISSHRDRLKLILIAGPSSAGKTTFAKRLTVQLQVLGLRPITLSTDDYFVGENRNPIGEDGKPDFEHLEAVDLEQFNTDLSRLVSGAEIERPRFNFASKKREYCGEFLKLAPDQLLIIEGIHGLNPRLTEQLPASCKYRIYISALTQLSLDSNNRISTTDNRLMRRMVRDHRYRGHTALTTLRLWPSVRRGEKKWIFPFQQEADATFNSALDYELSVLKPLVEPLLKGIKPSDPEYAEAQRISEFLFNFLGTDSRGVPRTSILREYIGGSAFKY